MKRVLMIAYFFPPCGVVGAIRVAKFVKYLKEFGWLPIVLSVEEKNYEGCQADYSLLSDIPPETPVIHTKVSTSRTLNNIGSRGCRWIPYLLPAALRAIKDHKVDLVYFTGDPFFQFGMAPLVKRLTKRDYVLDFRDMWTLSTYWAMNAGSVKGRLIRALIKRMEYRAIKDSAYSVFVTQGMRGKYAEFYNGKGISEDKLVVIPNGYDLEDFSSVVPVSFDRFTIIYSGKFWSFRDPLPFLKAFGLVDADIQFVHMGYIEDDVVRMVKSLGLENRVRFLGYVEHKECLSYVCGADLLLVIGGRDKTEPTTKIYEYLATGKPILAIAPRGGEIEGIVKSSKNNTFIDIEEDNIEEKIGAKITHYSKARTATTPQNNENFERRRLTRMLAQLFDTALA